MKRTICWMLALLMILALAPGALAESTDPMTMGQVSVVMPEIKVEINRTDFTAADVSATLGTERLTVEDVHVYDKTRDSACIYVVVDISAPMQYYMEPIRKLLTGFVEQLGPKEKLVLVTVYSEEMATVLKGGESREDQLKAISGLQFKASNKANARFFEALEYVYKQADNATERYDRQYVLAFSNGRDGHLGSTTANEALELYKSHKLPLYGFLANNKNNDGSDGLGQAARGSGGKCVYVETWGDYASLLDGINDVSIVTLRASNNIADKKTHPLNVQVGSTKLKAEVPVEDSIPDTVPPTAQAVFNRDAGTIDVTFSEPVDGAMETGNYILRNTDGQVLPVTMVEDRENQCYALTVDGLKDDGYSLSFQGIKDVSQEANPIKDTVTLRVSGAKATVAENDGLPLWLIITIGAVAVLAIAGLILALTAHARKKKEEAIQSVSAAEGAVPASEDLYQVNGQVQPEVRYHVLHADEGKRIRLLIRTGRASEQTVDTGIISSLIVGRADICDVYLDDGMLSRQHFVLENRDGRIFIQDLASKNGTWLNDIRIFDSQELRSGDRIKAGNSLFTITF